MRMYSSGMRAFKYILRRSTVCLYISHLYLLLIGIQASYSTSLPLHLYLLFTGLIYRKQDYFATERLVELDEASARHRFLCFFFLAFSVCRRLPQRASKTVT